MPRVRHTSGTTGRRWTGPRSAELPPPGGGSSGSGPSGATGSGSSVTGGGQGGYRSGGGTTRRNSQWWQTGGWRGWSSSHAPPVDEGSPPTGGSDGDSCDRSEGPMLATRTAEYSAGSSETTAVEVLLAIEDDRSAEPEPARTEEGPRVVWAVDGAGVVYLPQEERVRMEVVELEPYNPFDPHVLSARPRGRGRRSTRRCYACGATRAEHPSGRFCRTCAVCGRKRAMVPPASGADPCHDD